jgi:hypothetical protein
LAIKRYVWGALDEAPDDDAPDADEGTASATTYLFSAVVAVFASVAAGAALPLVAVADGLASRRQPVTVIVLPLDGGVAGCADCDEDVDELGVDGVAGVVDAGDCAIAAAETAKIVATNIPDQVVLFIIPPVRRGGCNGSATRRRARDEKANVAGIRRCFAGSPETAVFAARRALEKAKRTRPTPTVKK